MKRTTPKRFRQGAQPASLMASEQTDGAARRQCALLVQEDSRNEIRVLTIISNDQRINRPMITKAELNEYRETFSNQRLSSPFRKSFPYKKPCAAGCARGRSDGIPLASVIARGLDHGRCKTHTGCAMSELRSISGPIIILALIAMRIVGAVSMRHARSSTSRDIGLRYVDHSRHSPLSATGSFQPADRCS